MSTVRKQRVVAVLVLFGAVVALGGLLRLDVLALPAGTAPSGTLHMNPATGDSSTVYTLVFDQTESYCNGDGVAGYRWHTFITSATNDPATLTFQGTGTPSSGATGTGLTFALRTSDGSPIRAQTPTPVAGTQGFINPPLNMAFTATQFGQLVAGDYWIGIACTPDLTGESNEFWVGRITIADASGAGPHEFTFAAAAPPESTTTTSTTSTTVAQSTTTTTTVVGETSTTSTVDETTTTTLVGETTTTTEGTSSSTTTTATGSSSSTSTSVVGGGSATSSTLSSGAVNPSGGGGGRQLAETGFSSWRLVIWAVLLLVFGRMAILVGRTPKVIEEY